MQGYTEEEINTIIKKIVEFYEMLEFYMDEIYKAKAQDIEYDFMKIQNEEIKTAVKVWSRETFTEDMEEKELVDIVGNSIRKYAGLEINKMSLNNWKILANEEEIMELVDMIYMSANDKEQSIMVDVLKADSDMLSGIWEHINMEVQKNKFEEVIESVKDNPNVLIDIWKGTNETVQKEKQAYLPFIIESARDNLHLFVNIWLNTNVNVQKEKQEYLLGIMPKVKDEPNLFADLWRNIDADVQRKTQEYLPSIIEKLEEEPLIVDMWSKTDAQVQQNKFTEVMEKIKDRPYLLSSIWGRTNEEVQQNKFTEMLKNLKDNSNLLLGIWQNTKVKKGKFAGMFEKVKGRPQLLANIWAYTDEDIQKENQDYLIEILKRVKKSPLLLRDIWKFTSTELVENVKNNPNLATNIWVYATANIQRKNQGNFQNILENVMDKPYLLAYIWSKTDSEIQEKNYENLEKIVKKVKDSPRLFKYIWQNTSKTLVLEKFEEIENILYTNETMENYKAFIKLFLGDSVEFSEKGEPILPLDFKKAIFNSDDKKMNEKIITNLPNIRENWDTIKIYIQNKRANNIARDGLEVRSTSISEILEAYDKIVNPRPEPQTASAQEFENTKGADSICFDTQFTTSPITVVVQRAHDIAQKMDSATSKKKYPDFSIAREKICIKVLHPQDKKAILLGYNTGCCFRPTGNADNHGNNEYSLFQYCTTTPYGGVLVCEDIDENDIYMGTPILVSGNCMMFHSYESLEGKEAYAANRLLVEAAKKAIEDSKGSLNIVFMTNLHTGYNRLHTAGKIEIPSFFSAYTEGEYAKYKEMYNNLNMQNCVLAVNVGDEVLTGEKLVQWYEQECNNSPEVLKRKLNLYLGARTQDFDFGKRIVRNEISLAQPDLVNAFAKRKDELEKRREVLALVLQQKKLQSKPMLTHSEQEELAIISGRLEENYEKEFISQISESSIDDIRAKIEKNKEQQLQMYSGEDVDMIAEVKGIHIREEMEKVVKASLENKKTKEKGNSLKGKAIGKLISDIRKCKDESVSSIDGVMQKIKQGTLSEEELHTMEIANIDVSDYRKCFTEQATNIDQEKQVSNNESAIAQRLNKGMKDKSTKEKVVSSVLYKQVADEEIISKSKEKLILSLTSELYSKIAMKRKGKRTDVLTEEEANEVKGELRAIDVAHLSDAVISGKITEEQKKSLEELKNGELQVDIEAKYKEIMSDRGKIEKEIRSGKLAKLKAEVTLGMEQQKKIAIIQGRVDEAKRGIRASTTKLVYGNSWYIAIGSDGYVQEAVYNKKLDSTGQEWNTYIMANSKEQHHTKLEVEKAYIEKCTRLVSGEDKKLIIKKIRKKHNKKQLEENQKDREV
ncbi:MAG: hypothetical protein IKD76_06885 [Clostridia bacterium]|nr:hypothetical protein [Clostridia bacterium]